jgi:excisionase family DNA binding protein
MTDLPDKDLLRPDEVAKYFSLSVKTIYGWIDTGRIDAVRIAGTLRIRNEAVRSIIKEAT